MSRLDDSPASFEPDDDDESVSKSKGRQNKKNSISEAILITHLKVVKKLIKLLLEAISVLTTSSASAASITAGVIRKQAQTIVDHGLKSNSVIDILEPGREIAVNGSPVNLSYKQWIVLQILADRILGGDFRLVPIPEIVDEIERSFQDSPWKYPTSEDVAKTIFGLKRKLSKVTSATILESPEKQGAGYGYRLSIPPQNILVHSGGGYCNCVARP